MIIFNTLFYLLVEKKLFFNYNSPGDLGSSCASMNRTGKTNAKKGPKVDYNAYKDFHDREVETNIVASFVKFSGMIYIQGFNFYSLLNIVNSLNHS